PYVMVGAATVDANQCRRRGRDRRDCPHDRHQGVDMASKRDRQQLLGQVPLFSACSDKELDRLARHAELVDFRAGETLMSEGQTGQEFYVIVDGEVGVTSAGDTLAKLG